MTVNQSCEDRRKLAFRKNKPSFDKSLKHLTAILLYSPEYRKVITLLVIDMKWILCVQRRDSKFTQRFCPAKKNLVGDCMGTWSQYLEWMFLAFIVPDKSNFRIKLSNWFSDELTTLSIASSNSHLFHWKYHILPILLLRSEKNNLILLANLTHLNGKAHSTGFILSL